MTVSSLRQAVYAGLGQRFFYGWVILAVAGLGIFASGPGQSHTFSVFIGPVSRELDIGRTWMAVAYGLATSVAAFGLPLVGRVVDRFGPRSTTLVVSVLLGFACVLFSLVGGVATLALAFVALRFLGQGSLMLNCSNLVAQWFSARRGFAMSLMALGFSASMAVHPPLAQWLADTYGWRTAWIVLAVSTWALLLPAFALFVFDKPEGLGLRPDGEAAPAAGTAPPAITGLTLKQALAGPAFYIIAAGMFSISMLVTALHFYQVSILVSQGLEPQVPARVFPVSALTMVLAMPLIGRMLDKLPTHLVFALSLTIMAAALGAVNLVTDIPTAIAYAVLFGVLNGFSMSMFGFLWARYFGRRHLGSIQGTGQMITVIGASLGPLPFGIAYDLTGSYQSTLLLFALLPLAIAIVALLKLRPPALD
jgi:MFS family permease